MIYSAGIIPFRRNSKGEVEFFVGHPGGVGWQWKDYWAYLKGGVEGEETWEETALREFREESGLKQKKILFHLEHPNKINIKLLLLSDYIIRI